MIQFLGPRSKTNKSVGLFASAAGHGSAAPAGPTGNAKPLSPQCEVEYADIPATRWARIALSEIEMEIVNQGTNDIDQDWRSIRLWEEQSEVPPL